MLSLHGDRAWFPFPSILGLMGTEPMGLQGWLYVFPRNCTHQGACLQGHKPRDLPSLPFHEASPSLADHRLMSMPGESCCQQPDTVLERTVPKQF